MAIPQVSLSRTAVFPHLEVKRLPEQPLDYFDAVSQLKGLIGYLEAMTYIGILEGTVTLDITTKKTTITRKSMTLLRDPNPTAERRALLDTAIHEIHRRAKLLVGRDIKAKIRCTYLPE